MGRMPELCIDAWLFPKRSLSSPVAIGDVVRRKTALLLSRPERHLCRPEATIGTCCMGDVETARLAGRRCWRLTPQPIVHASNAHESYVARLMCNNNAYLRRYYNQEVLTGRLTPSLVPSASGMTVAHAVHRSKPPSRGTQ